MKLVKVGLMVMAAMLPLLGWSKAKLMAFQVGDTVLEPEDFVTFTMDDSPDSIGEFDVLSEYLPDGISVEWTGKKFKAPKSGRVKYSKKEEAFVATNDDNPCGFKVSVNKKSGKVKGSFKVYVEKSETKLKSHSAKFTGYLGGNIIVTIKNGGQYAASLD